MRIGTDCSGMESPIYALNKMGIKIQHVFSCDTDKWSKTFIKQNYTCDNCYDSIVGRNHTQLPDIDIYICGFPCQSFSNIGAKKGMSDPRSGIKDECVSVINTKQPKIFILENVKQFTYLNKGKLIKDLVESFPDYNVQWKVLNTFDFGIPQNRERVYIVGILKDCLIKPFQFPEGGPCEPISNFLIENEIRNIPPTKNQKKFNPDWANTDKYLFSTDQGFGNCMENKIQTITTKGSVFLSKYQRRVLPDELLLLQGFKLDLNWTGISKTQKIKLIGNTMSVNVLIELFKEIFKCVEI